MDMDDELKKLMEMASRNVAGDLFKQRPQLENIAPMKGLVDYLEGEISGFVRVTRALLVASFALTGVVVGVVLS